jgi:Skp family chaperone for outer membrane proteins
MIQIVIAFCFFIAFTDKVLPQIIASSNSGKSQINSVNPTDGLSQKGKAEISQVEAQSSKDPSLLLKYGYVDLQEVINKSSAGVKAQQELKNFVKQKQNVIDMKEKEIQEFKQKAANPNMKDSMIWLGALSLYSMDQEKKKLIDQSQKKIETKRQELTSTIMKELLWKMKRLGKTDNYGLILSKEGLSLLEGKILTDNNTNIFYRNANTDINRITTLGVEDFDDITKEVIAFFDKGEIITTEQKINIISDIQSRNKESSKINISVEVQPELFPVIAKFISEGNEGFDIPGLVKWQLHNEGSETVTVSVTSEVSEWTPPVIKTIEIGPYESKELTQTPFGTNLLKKHEIIPATLALKVKKEDKVIFEETRNIKIRAADDMIWSLHSPSDTVYLIAAWVTPKDPVVEQILTIAKEKKRGRSLSGYLQPDVTEQVRAIFNAVRDIGVSYVNSTMSFGQVGFTQRVRLPKESINQRAANCIDGAVLLASLFENVGLEPLIILVPGHAFVGVRLAAGAKETLFIETTLLGREVSESILTGETTFNAAVRIANEEYMKAANEAPYKSDALYIIDVKKAREMGIYPL